MKLLTVLVAALVWASSTSATEPLNLSTAKAAVIRYVDSGEYDKDLATEAKRAGSWIAERVARKTTDEKLVLVLDVDETALSNWPHMRDRDFGYIPSAWDEWVAEGIAPAIKPVKAVYDMARANGVTVFFITGRKESDRPGTEKNLSAMGFADYEQLICKPLDFEGTSEAYKTQARQRLEKDGWTIIANVGDQPSDLAGGASEKVFKLVNPFYLIE